LSTIECIDTPIIAHRIFVYILMAFHREHATNTHNTLTEFNAQLQCTFETVMTSIT